MSRVTGTQVNYFFICKTKLWLFSHNIQMEQRSDLVAQGKFIHEHSYPRKKKDVTIDNTIGIDFIQKGDSLEIHEVKKSSKMEDAHRWQLIYYLYYLKKDGVKAIGVIDYPKLKQKIKVELTSDEEKKLISILNEIPRIISSSCPPAKRKKICKKCAYEDFCFCGEEE